MQFQEENIVRLIEVVLENNASNQDAQTELYRQLNTVQDMVEENDASNQAV